MPGSSRSTSAGILMYHGIRGRAQVSGVTNYFRYNISQDALKEHLAWLSKHCNPVSLAEMRTGRRLAKNKPNVIVTFDDGYENNYTLAFPLLKRYRVPAVFALPTAFVCDREPLWNDIVEHAVNHTSKARVRFKWAGVTREFAIDDLAGRLALNKWVIGECVRVQQERRTDLIEAAVDALGVTSDARILFRNADYRPLTLAQIGEMAESGLIEFASHSVHHYLLTLLRPGTRRRELRESKERLEALTGIPCTTFSVPGGFFNDDVLRDAVAAGYEAVMTSVRGRTAPGNQVLNRNVLMDGDNVQMLAEAVNGVH